jgi:hypothetical protein
MFCSRQGDSPSTRPALGQAALKGDSSLMFFWFGLGVQSVLCLHQRLV